MLTNGHGKFSYNPDSNARNGDYERCLLDKHVLSDQSPYEKYKAKEDERNRRAQDRLPLKWYWFGERDPVARFTLVIGIFTALLVIVGILQFCTLQRTNEIAEESERAWIGTTSAKLTDAVKAGKPIKLALQYQNSGHQPANNLIPEHAFQQFTIMDWNNGTAGRHLQADARDCLAFKSTGVSTIVAFPNLGTTAYTLAFDSSQVGENPKSLYIPNQDVEDGRAVMVVYTCFLYRSGARPHHTGACYFYQSGVTTPGNDLGICRTGNDAD